MRERDEVETHKQDGKIIERMREKAGGRNSKIGEKGGE